MRRLKGKLLLLLIIAMCATVIWSKENDNAEDLPL